MLAFLKKAKTPLLPLHINEAIVEAIKQAELLTSGEIRVFIESKCRFLDPLNRAKEVFTTLKMDKTENKNGVLIYLAIKDKQMAIYGDEGIHEKLGYTFWKNELSKMQNDFRNNNMSSGLVQIILEVGNALKTHFPYHNEDKNELPDAIVFGK